VNVAQKTGGGHPPPLTYWLYQSAAPLCAEAKAGQTLVGRRVLAEIESLADAEPLGEGALKGFARPVSMFNVVRMRA
jgi:class 3 adenylate cyclase